MASVAVMRPGDLPQIGYPSTSTCNKATSQRSLGRGQSQRAVSRPARKVAPAGWTMCECEADKDWILCDRAEAMAAEIAQIFKKNVAQDSQEEVKVHVTKDEDALPGLQSAAKEATMARFQLQLEEEERAAHSAQEQVENHRDVGGSYDSNQRSALADEENEDDDESVSPTKRQLATGAESKKKGLERRTKKTATSPRDDSEPAENENCEASLQKGEEGRARARPSSAKPRASSRRRKNEAKSASDFAESDDFPGTSHVSDPSDKPFRKLSKAERKAANARELELQDPPSQQMQNQSRAGEHDSQKAAKSEKRTSNDSKESDDSSASCKHRGKSRKSRRATQDDYD